MRNLDGDAGECGSMIGAVLVLLVAGGMFVSNWHNVLHNGLNTSNGALFFGAAALGALAWLLWLFFKNSRM